MSTLKGSKTHENLKASFAGETPGHTLGSYNSEVITQDIHRYMSRDWQASRDSKDAYWAARIDRLGPGEGLRIADELRRQAILQNPGWPGADDRRDDLAAHVRLAELLRRVARTGGR